MRMLVVNWRCTRNPLAGGAEIYFQEIFSRLVAKGHTVTLLAERFAGSAPEEIIGGIRVLRMGGKWTFNFASYRNVGRLADEGDYDIVIDDLNKIPFYSPWFTRRPVLAILMHLFRGSIFRETLPPMAAYVWLTESMIPWAYKNCRFAVLSDSSKRDVVKLGIPEERVAVIPPGTDFERFRPEEDKPRIDTDEHGSGGMRNRDLPRRHEGSTEIPGQSPSAEEPAGAIRDSPGFPLPVILHVGRLKRYKSTHHLLEAARLLKSKGLRFEVVIVGEGDDKPRLEKAAAKLDVTDVVRFTGFISEEEKIQWYRRAAVLVENSVKEGWGLIVMEANGCGTPVVVARSPGLVDSSRDGVNGLFYEYGNVGQLAEKLELVLTDEALRARLGEQAIGWARQWSWDKAAEDMEQAISRTIEEAKARMAK